MSSLHKAPCFGVGRYKVKMVRSHFIKQ